jgi:Iap family predicted aminopeptidase
MKRSHFCVLLSLLFGSASLSANDDLSIRERLLGAAFLDNQSYDLLGKMTNEYGPRLTGTRSNELSMDMLEKELELNDITTRREAFTIPGWVRKNDEAILLHPIKRKLRAIALGYVDSHPTFEADIINIGKGKDEDLPEDAKGKIGLVAPNVRLSQAEIQNLSEKHGIKGILLINRKNGGQLLARTPNHAGLAAPIPVYNITEEEGFWLQRLIQQGASPRIQLTTRSYVKEMTTANLVATLPGKVEKKIVVGAHFDSWDLGQGALDNGLGVAQAFDIIRLLKNIHPENYYTVEVVWFNGEEWGLFGSRAYMEAHADDDIFVMINMDMVGNPIGANAMGFDSLIPFLEKFSTNLKAYEFAKGVDNKPWLGSDHHPFILKGIPAITLNAPIKPEAVKFYHDFADTFDKVDRIDLAKSIGILTLLTYELANNETLELQQKTEKEVIELLRENKLEERMKRSNAWPFETETD